MRCYCLFIFKLGWNGLKKVVGDMSSNEEMDVLERVVQFVMV